jgi:hypothetical protein
MRIEVGPFYRQRAPFANPMVAVSATARELTRRTLPQILPAVKCPSCKKSVKDDQAVCPHCDAVLDESILGPMPDDDAEMPAPAPKRKAPQKAAAGTTARAPVKAPAKVASKKPLRPAPLPAPDPEEQPEPEDGEAEAPSAARQQDAPPASKYAQYWEEDDYDKKARAEREAAKGAAARETGRGPAAAASAKPGDDTGMEELTEQIKTTLAAAWKWFAALDFEDKLTTGAAASLWVMSFMPWRSHVDTGDDMGLMTWGFVTMLIATAVVAGVWARTSEKLPQVPEKLWTFYPMVTGGLAALICLAFIYGSFESGHLAGRTVLRASPSFGAFFALLSGGVIALSGYLRKRRQT